MIIMMRCHVLLLLLLLLLLMMMMMMMACRRVAPVRGVRAGAIAEGGGARTPCTPCVLTGAGGDNGIDRDKNRLRFPYDSTFLRSHYLHSHPHNGSE